MRMFVTGATGFIGSHVVNAARAAGHEVVGLRRPRSTPRVPVDLGVDWIEGDLAEIRSSDLAGVDAVIHLAAAGVNPAAANWNACFQTNVIDSLALWNAAAQGGVRRLIVCGSCFEYGAHGARHEAIPPSAALEPTGPYHASKAAATMAACGLAHEQGLECAILRPFHVFGEGEDASRLWPSLRGAALAGADYPMTPGQQVRDFVPVGDVAASFLSVCVDRPLEPGRPEVHNVGTGHPVTILEFAEYWWRRWGAAGRLLPGAIAYRPGEVMRYVPEITL